MRAPSSTDGVDFSISRMMANLGDGRAGLDALIEDMPPFDVHIKPGGENNPSSRSVKAKESPRCQLELRSLRGNVGPSADRTGWENLLDAMWPAPAAPERGTSDVRIQSLADFEVRPDIGVQDVLVSHWASVGVDGSPLL